MNFVYTSEPDVQCAIESAYAEARVSGWYGIDFRASPLWVQGLEADETEAQLLAAINVEIKHAMDKVSPPVLTRRHYAHGASVHSVSSSTFW